MFIFGLYIFYISFSVVGGEISIFLLILINEIFLERLAATKPRERVTPKTKNIINAMMFSARAKTFDDYSKNIVFDNSRVVVFFKSEIGFKPTSQVANLKLDEFLSQAKDLVVWVSGNYITEVDLFAAYILLSEDETKFLQKNNLDNDDVINILYWARRKYKPDKIERDSIRLYGNGVFDNLVNSWNYELRKYAVDLTAEVMMGKFPPVISGQEKEFEELSVALSKEASSNAILIGDPGTGKSSIVSYLAYAAFSGKLNNSLSKKRVYELLVDKILSGVENTGDLESRLSLLLSDIAHSGQSIVYIPNIESIFGGGGYGFDISGVLEEYIKGERINIIGTTSSFGFASFIENKKSIVQNFEKIEINPLSPGKTMLLLTDKVAEIEYKYHLKINYSVLKEVILTSSNYYPDRLLPGGAVSLLEDVASAARLAKKRKITSEDVKDLVQKKTNIILKDPDRDEKETLIHLEEKIHEKVVGQDEAVKAVADAMRRLRSGFKDDSKPISVFLFLGPTGVGKTETAKVLTSEYFGDKSQMIRLDMSEYQSPLQVNRLLGESAGEEYAENSLVAQVEKNPFSLILLDEFEKAHPSLLNIFLQVFDEGRLTDNRGKTISFKNSIIIATSNAGSEFIREKIENGQEVVKKELIDYLLKNNFFTPELVNRFDEIIEFHPLSKDEVLKISELSLGRSLLSLEKNGTKVIPDERVYEKIAADSFSPEFGARNIAHYIEENVESFLSKLILEDKIRRGEDTRLSVDDNGNYIIL
ncbi:MAG TPA: AAA family ATPase [Patescibacteria group bacterium]|nr:AAA family ATPase [Patescibacteria group bacterium]